MCTFLSDRAAMVCDVAIPHVREEIEGRFGNAVSFTVRDGEGTLVQGDGTIDPKAFSEAVRAGMARTAAGAPGLK
jgi:hypothetical protein